MEVTRKFLYKNMKLKKIKPTQYVSHSQELLERDSKYSYYLVENLNLAGNFVHGGTLPDNSVIKVHGYGGQEYVLIKKISRQKAVFRSLYPA